ncbi:MAG: hypothetical protein AB1422_10250 [bacterium]
MWKIVRLVILGVVFLSREVMAADLFVNPGQSIQSAINAANNGDTIYISADTYSRRVEILSHLL